MSFLVRFFSRFHLSHYPSSFIILDIKIFTSIQFSMKRFHIHRKYYGSIDDIPHILALFISYSCIYSPFILMTFSIVVMSDSAHTDCSLFHTCFNYSELL